MGLASGFPGLLFTRSDDANPVCAAFCSVGCVILRAFLMFGVFFFARCFSFGLNQLQYEGGSKFPESGVLP